MRNDNIALAVWLVAVAATLIVFGIWPRLDLTVAEMFYTQGAGFWLGDNALAGMLRMLLWDATIVLCVVALIGLVIARATGGAALWMPARIWAFILLLYVTGPGLIVNAILKEHWGRARPASIWQFGGNREFTPAFLPADECARNCSFMSGEAAAAAALGIGLYVILRHLRLRLSLWQWRAGVTMAIAVTVVGAMLRVMTGRHFLSDATCAVLIVAGLALLLERLILRGRPLQGRLSTLMPRRKIHRQTAPDAVLTSPATPPIRRDT